MLESAPRKHDRVAEGDAYHAFALGLPTQFSGSSTSEDFATIEKGNPVAQLLRLIHVVGGQDDRSVFRAEAEDQLLKVPPRLRIKTDSRFVHEDKFGIVDERQGDG